MTRLERILRQVSRDLESQGLDWAVVGGLAVSVRTEPRFTRDADLAVAVRDDVQAETVTRTFLQRGYRLLASVEQQAVNRLATVRLLPPGESQEGVVVDLLFASSGIEDEVVRAAEELEILPRLNAPVIQSGHLIALKILSRDARRPQDSADLKLLLAGAEETDLQKARSAIRLIIERGYSRKRDLMAELEKTIDSLGPTPTRPS